MQIELHRTFGEFTESQLSDDEVDWREYFSSQRGRMTWRDLHTKRVVVVLGEAGIGKTVEFQLEAQRLRHEGHPAFFLPLNLIGSTNGWQLALGDAIERFTNWEASTDEGYFFLDAVDEARLQAHSDFTRALLVVRQALAPHMARVRIAISSRVTDWTVPEVATAVSTHLLRPINQAISTVTAQRTPLQDGAGLANDKPTTTEELLVVTLDALSRGEAKRCAHHFNLQCEDDFWRTVDDGNYDFMASRPLDLRWMVELWNKRRTLGSYVELIEANVSNRLREFNPSYQQSRRVLSEDRLRAGAMELAAAAEFGGCAFVAVPPDSPRDTGVLDPLAVLSDWEQPDVQLLLATAIFDEASLGRVKFHHRSIREYLAARWVDAKAILGVPFGRLQPLFSNNPFGELIIIPARRPVLGWLAAINVHARAWVISKCPELFLYEGDPQSWDSPSASQAFHAVVERSKSSPRVRWFKSASECRRVARSLSPSQVAAVLRDGSTSEQIRSISYQLARYGKIEDCAEPAFSTYQDTTRSEWERVAALSVLEVVGSTTHRAQVLADLESGAVVGNELIAHALPVIDWKGLTDAKLAQIFSNTQSERNYGSGPLAQTVKDNLLPDTDLPSATLLLSAVISSLPRPITGTRFARFSEESQPERAWLLNVLPSCFERVLALVASTNSSPPSVCLDAAEWIESQRHSGFTDRDEFTRLYEAIKALPELRWKVALGIAQSTDINHSISRLTWNGHCIVGFDIDDLPELTRLAHDPSLLPGEQEIWFQVGIEIALRLKGGRNRNQALCALCGPNNELRLSAAIETYKRQIAGAMQRQQWKSNEKQRKAKQLQEFASFKASLLENLASIANGTNLNSLKGLLHFSFDLSHGKDRLEVDLEAIASCLGPELADAFGQGLRTYWRTATPPNPSDYPNGSFPWEALLALAGVNLTMADGVNYAQLSRAEVVAAAQVAAWALPGPPEWLLSLHSCRALEVEQALQPWVQAEAQASQPGNGVRGALDMTLRCPPTLRRGLLTGIAALVLRGTVTNQETLKKLVPALFEDGLLTLPDLGSVCLQRLQSSLGPNGRIEDLSWWRIWAKAASRDAWNWFRKHIEGMTGEVGLQVHTFASAMEDLKWLAEPWSQTTVDLLLEVSDILSQHQLTSTPPGDQDSAFFGPPTKRMLEGIARTLVSMRGPLARQALEKLLAKEVEPERRLNLGNFLMQHAEQEAAASSIWQPDRLKSIHCAFATEPRTEDQLYEQVIARLEEIRTNVEEGPFSERDLFQAGIEERYIQRWLAAKFLDTKNRRFSIHREEEVDDDKLTDIQLSCPSGNICIEIKPLDASRGYSANSLVEDTLKRQIVGQYLRGTNSSHGILVLIKLDNKQWEIPGLSSRRSFEELVVYLKSEAARIKEGNPTIAALNVFAIRCVI